MNYFDKDAIKQRLEQAQIEKYGKVLTDEEVEKIQNKEQNEQDRKVIQLNIDKWVSSVPPRFKSATFESFDLVAPSAQYVIEHLKTGKSAVLSGSNGSGKTHLAYASCLEQAMKGRSVCFVLAFNFFTDIKESFDKGNTSDVVARYVNYDYLVIDEADKTHGSQNEFVYLYSLINERYDNMKPTVLVSNSDPATLMAVVGKSTFDRIASEGKVIEMKWKNYRQKR